MSMLFAPGVTSKSVRVQIVDDSGLAVTGLVAATFPTLTYWVAGANAAVAFPTLTDLAALTTAFSAGGVKEISGGYYRLDVPDAAWSAAGKVGIIGEATGKHVLCEVIDVGYPQVDIRQAGGNASTTTASGVLDVNVKNYNNQTAQTDANNLPKVDVEDIKGTASAGAAGYFGPDWGHVNAPTTAVVLSGTTIGTLTTYTNNTPQTGDSYAVVNNGTSGNAALHTQISTITTAILSAVGSPIQAGNVTVGAIAAGAITDAAFTMPAEAAGRPSTFLAIVRRIWEWRVNKKTRDTSALPYTILLRNAADSATLETQTQTTTGTTDIESAGV